MQTEKTQKKRRKVFSLFFFVEIGTENIFSEWIMNDLLNLDRTLGIFCGFLLKKSSWKRFSVGKTIFIRFRLCGTVDCGCENLHGLKRNYLWNGFFFPFFVCFGLWRTKWKNKNHNNDKMSKNIYWAKRLFFLYSLLEWLSESEKSLVSQNLVSCIVFFSREGGRK